MKYMLLIYDEEKSFATMPPAEMGQLMADYRAFSEDLIKRGNHITSSQLQPATSATSIRIRDGKRMVTDGPFAETREQLGGYYVVEAKDLDEAIEIAARIPSAKIGTIEVRPLMQASAPATA